MRTRAELESIHRFSDHHRELLAQSERASCFSCLASYSPTEIEDWVDGRQIETGDLDDGVTALCPRCGIDAVLPSAAPIGLDDELLSEMKGYFF